MTSKPKENIISYSQAITIALLTNCPPVTINKMSKSTKYVVKHCHTYAHKKLHSAVYTLMHLA